MKTTLVYVCFFLFALNAIAESNLDELEIKAIKNAKSEAELTIMIKEVEKVRTMKVACDLQISSAKLPYSCYEARNLMKKLKLATTNWLSKDLDQVCIRIAHQTDEIILRKHQSLPKACLMAAQAQIQINQYKSGKVFD